MDNLLWTDAPYAFWIFLLLTVVLGGAGAYATGRALAKGWRSPLLLGPYMIVLSAAVQFLHFALYQEPLLSPHYYLIALIWNLIASMIGYRIMRAQQMATQYSWLYEKAGASWRPRAGA
jgi:hypothetical protein